MNDVETEKGKGLVFRSDVAHPGKSNDAGCSENAGFL
jgi:hypothetical protein